MALRVVWVLCFLCPLISCSGGSEGPAPLNWNAVGCPEEEELGGGSLVAGAYELVLSAAGERGELSGLDAPDPGDEWEPARLDLWETPAGGAFRDAAHFHGVLELEMDRLGAGTSGSTTVRDRHAPGVLVFGAREGEPALVRAGSDLNRQADHRGRLIEGAYLVLRLRVTGDGRTGGSWESDPEGRGMTVGGRVCGRLVSPK